VDGEVGVSGADPCADGDKDEKLKGRCIDKYVTPLVILPVMHPSKTDGTADHYSISVRQFKQQILPGGVWGSEVWGLLTAPLRKEYGATPVFGYGPKGDPMPDGRGQAGFFNVLEERIAPAPNSQYNSPAYTIENVKDTGACGCGAILVLPWAVVVAASWTPPRADLEGWRFGAKSRLQGHVGTRGTLVLT
jgi:hypothetical protein